MSASPDFYGYALAAGVAALFGWYFFSLARRLLTGTLTITRFLDGRAAKQRAELERELREGPAPLWLKAARVLVLAVLFGGVAALIWIKFTGL